MSRLFRRAVLSVGAAGLVIAFSATPAPAGVGTRLVNGDGDTAGKCMAITNSGQGTSVEMQPCNTNAHQGWELRQAPSYPAGIVTIVSQDTDARGRCLTAHAEGVRVTMDRCAAPDSDLYAQQLWAIKIVNLYSNWFQYVNVGLTGVDEQCLDVRANGLSNVVQTWLCGPPDKGNQLWKFW